MPQNPVTDPISDRMTDQEIVFARLILYGTMTDREAAEVAGLDPATAARTMAQPHVQAYIIEHRAAVKQKKVDQQAESLPEFSIGREQILKRLWELALISPELTRGSMAGQIKAMSMIVAIEGLIPDRRRSAAPAQPATPAAEPQIYVSKWRREGFQETEEEQPPFAQTQAPADAKTPAEPHIAPEAPGAESQPGPATEASAPSPNPNPATPSQPTHSRPENWVPDARDSAYDTRMHPAADLEPFALRMERLRRGR